MILPEKHRLPPFILLPIGSYLLLWAGALLSVSNHLEKQHQQLERVIRQLEVNKTEHKKTVPRLPQNGMTIKKIQLLHPQQIFTAFFSPETFASHYRKTLQDTLTAFKNHTGGLDFSKMDFSGMQLGAARLKQTNLHETRLKGINLQAALLNEANLGNTDLRSANLIDADLRGVNFFYADLQGADLSGANLENTSLSGADFRKVNLSKANLSGAVLGGARLDGAKLSQARLSGADLRYADLSNTIGLNADQLIDVKTDARTRFPANLKAFKK